MWTYVAFSLWLACGEYKDTDPEPADTSDPSPGLPGEYTIVGRDDAAACGGAVPMSRRYAQMAYFYQDQGAVLVPDGSRSHWIERGFLLYGGKNDNLVLNDLWLYDLSTEGATRHNLPGCPWFQLSSDAAADGRYGGSMHIWGNDVVQVGGITEGDTRASDHVRRASLLNLPAGFDDLAQRLPPTEYHAAEASDPICSEPLEYYCKDSAGTAIEQGWLDPCSEAASGFFDIQCTCLNGVSLTSGCAEAPICTDGVQVDYPAAWASGLGFFGAADDGTANVRVYGGLTGCSAGDCRAWDPLWALADPPAPDVLFGANNSTPLSVDLVTGSAYSTGSAGMFDGLVYDWAPSVGLSRLSAVSLGRDWDYGGRQFVGPHTDYLVGGSVHQVLYPDRQHLVEVDGGGCPAYSSPESDCVVTYTCINSSTWKDQPHPTLVGGIEGDFSVGRLSSGGWLMEVAPFGLAEVPAAVGSARYDTAVSRFETDTLVVVGGRDQAGGAIGNGTNSHFVVDVGTGEIAQVSIGADPARYGASVVHDPFLNDAFYFGGTLSNDDVMQMRSRFGPTPNRDSTFEITAAEVELKDVSVVDEWWISAGLEITHRCHRDPSDYPEIFDGDQPPTNTREAWDASHCFADRITLYSPDGLNLVDTGTFLFSGRGLDGAELLPVDQGDHVFNGVTYTGVSFRLPKAMLDGDTFVIELRSGQANIYDANSALQPTPGTMSTFSYGSDPATAGHGFSAMGFPLWVAKEASTTASDAMQALENFERPVPLPTLRVATQPGWTTLSLGSPVSCDPSLFSILWVPETDGSCSTPDPGATTSVRRWSVLGLDEGVGPVASDRPELMVYADNQLTVEAMAWVEDYAASTGATTTNSLSADVDWLTDRLGPYPVDPVQIVFLRSNLFFEEGRCPEGLAYGPGLIALQGTDGTGVLYDANACGTPAMAVSHELAHAWFGLWRDTDVCVDEGSCQSTLWFHEGMSEYLAWLRHPLNPQTQEAPYIGLKMLVRHALSGDPEQAVEQDLEHPAAASFEHKYRIAPYTLSQLHQIDQAANYPDAYPDAAPRFLPTLQDLWSEPVGTPLKAPDVEAWANGLLVEGDYQIYDQWIERDRLGTPLLGLTGGTWDPDLKSGTLQVSQIQVDAVGWPAFNLVPFLLGSEQLSTGARVFTGTHATKDTLEQTVPFLLGSEDTTIPIGLVGTIVGPGLPAEVALLSNHMLLDGSVPTFGISDGVTPRVVAAAEPRYREGEYDEFAAPIPAARTWIRWCDSPTDPSCQPDDDGDGFDDPLTGLDGSDCDPDDAAHHPLQPDPTAWSPTTVDENCDGWSGHLLFPPPPAP